MAFNKLRGQQIKDSQIENKHIKGKLAESVLDIDFISHAGEILNEKLLVDYVQKEGITLLAGSPGARITLGKNPGDITPAATETETGAILKTQKDYKVIIRDQATGEPLIDADDREVYGYLDSYDVDDYHYTLNLYVEAAGTGADVAYSVPGTEDLIIDIVYPQRFTLDTVGEMFAANTKFVDGSADVTSHLNLTQMVNDIFGNAYSLNANGETTDFLGNGKTLLQHLIDETTGILSGEKAKDIIDEVVAGRDGKLSLHARFNQIEQYIYEGGAIDTRFKTIENELTAARTNGTKTWTSLGLRLDDIEKSVTDAKDAIFADLANTTDINKGANLVHVNETSDIYDKWAITKVGTALDNLLGEIDTRVTEEENARIADTNLIRTNLASTATNQGASLIGVEDAGNKFTDILPENKTVENILLELFKKINTDVAAEATARTSADNALQTQITANKDTLDTAAGTQGTLDARLDIALRDDGTLKGLENFHRHHKKVNKPLSAGNVISFVFTGSDQFSTPKLPSAGDVYDVYINGMQQSEGYHYSISIVDAPTGTNKEVVVTFNSIDGENAFYADDVVELRATIHATQQP